MAVLKNEHVAQKLVPRRVPKRRNQTRRPECSLRDQSVNHALIRMIGGNV